MRIVLWHVAMALDGFIAGPGGSMDLSFNTRPERGRCPFPSYRRLTNACSG
jgi:hypothetical protein